MRVKVKMIIYIFQNLFLITRENANVHDLLIANVQINVDNVLISSTRQITTEFLLKRITPESEFESSRSHVSADPHICIDNHVEFAS